MQGFLFSPKSCWALKPLQPVPVQKLGQHVLGGNTVRAVDTLGGGRVTLADRFQHAAVIGVRFAGQRAHVQRDGAGAAHLIAHHADDGLNAGVSPQPDQLGMETVVGIGPGDGAGDLGPDGAGPCRF